MILARLTNYLDGNGIKYIVIHHSPAFTAREVAVLAHIPRSEVAKTVIVKVDGKAMMAVLPASEMVDLALLRTALNANAVVLATEREFNTLFPDCEIGAMPPLGNLFGIDVVVADSLRNNQEIAFNGGNHREVLKMSYADFERLVKPLVRKFTMERRVRADLFERGIS
ncbi:MAG: YbaK/EbsC family protein [Bacteroidetes bacterium]|nr:YbaK/EbsC family protein [Bacteroidota bacterium]MCW5894520.1 YbaK/EbsC family protein [Bacteroidota bacterium]